MRRATAAPEVTLVELDCRDYIVLLLLGRYQRVLLLCDPVITRVSIIVVACVPPAGIMALTSNQ